MQRIKQVILVRKDLNMRRGKEIAQGSHASMQFIVERIRQNMDENNNANIAIGLSPAEKIWLAGGMAKICLRVNSEKELLDHHAKALLSGLRSYLVEDSGRTEFSGVPTLTACAIGPDDAESIDRVTGDLVPY